MLNAEYTKAFQRDIKRLKRKHVDFTELKNVIRLVLEDTDEAKETLRRRHRAHACKAASGSVWSNAMSAMLVTGSPFGFGKMALHGFFVRVPMRRYSATDKDSIEIVDLFCSRR